MRQINFLQILLFFLLIGFTTSCKKEEPILQTGQWRGVLKVSEKEELPFVFQLSTDTAKGYKMEIQNGEERVVVNDMVVAGDSLRIQMPFFEGYIKGSFTENEMEGEFIKESLSRIVSFSATRADSPRFVNVQPATVEVSGNWKTTFQLGLEDEYPAKGVFQQSGNTVLGTFLTTTGDYRYLEGVVSGDSLKLSTFDGAHAFLFVGKVKDSVLDGIFYSGNHSVETFTAVKDEAFELPDSNTLTFLNSGYDRFNFDFPDASGQRVTLDDSRFMNKPVLVQIMGTWCPNCLDETKYYTNYIKNHPESDVEWVALAFEYAPTEEKAWKGIERLRKRLAIEYPILLAQFGTSNKVEAQKKLPMLNHVLSYPTTIYLDRNHEVVKIHTGFNGPATGEKYVKFQQEFETTLDSLTTVRATEK
ncbi:MAG: TlpA disulfide reductase family protein [Bacteroidota bacterium]